MLICAGGFGATTLGAVIPALKLDCENDRAAHFEGHWKTTEREEGRRATVEESVRDMEEFILVGYWWLRCSPDRGIISQLES